MTVRHLDALFRGRQIALLGTASNVEQYQLVANLEHSAAPGRLIKLHQVPTSATWPSAELAVVLEREFSTPEAVAALGAAGCRALVWAARGKPDPHVLEAAKPFGIRLLGPRSVGIIHTANHLNVSSLPLEPRPGSVAMIAQSQSIAAGAVDWAVGRGIGFSWIAVTGAEADIDASDLLDYAALDPQTRAVVLQISSIRHARKFMSAARAAARTKPVLVLQTQRSVDGEAEGPDPIRSAAFERAGLVECEHLGALFDGLVALELLPPITGSRIAVVGNGSGACALGINAVLRHGLKPVRLSEDALQRIALAAPTVRHRGSVVDLGHNDSDHTAQALRAAIECKASDVVLFIHSPTAGEPHEPLAATLTRAQLGPRLLTVWLGLETAAIARRINVMARTSTFPTADDAVRAVKYRAQHRLTQALLTRTPPADPEVTADVEQLRARLSALAASGDATLSAADVTALFGAYGILDAPAAELIAATEVRITATQHRELGMVLSVDDGLLRTQPAYGFAPLDDLLARRMLATAGCSDETTSDAAETALAFALKRIACMVADLPEIEFLDAHFVSDARGHLERWPGTAVRVRLQPIAERQRLALAQYPSTLEHELRLRRGHYEIRPVRPADEPAVLDLLGRLDAEEIRLRFFNYIRHFTHDMAARLTQVDYDREMALIAIPQDHPDQIVALGTLIADPDGSEAEYAIIVHHDHTQIGLGRHLMDELIERARRIGVRKVYGEILAENGPMLALARGLGFNIRTDPDDPGCKRTEFLVQPTSEAVRARA